MPEEEYISFELTEDQVLEAAQKLANWLQEEIDRGHRVGPFTILFTLAVAVDFAEFLGTVTLIKPLLDVISVGILGDSLASWILYFFMRQQGWFLQRWVGNKINKYELKFIYWFFSVADWIPGVSALPLQTFGVWKIWKKVKKRSEEAEIELEELHYTTAQTIEQIRETEAEEATEEETQETEPQAQRSEAGVRENEEADFPDESASSEPKKETLEEIFIPKKIRDPMEDLKHKYFEPQPDTPQRNEQQNKDNN